MKNNQQSDKQNFLVVRENEVETNSEASDYYEFKDWFDEKLHEYNEEYKEIKRGDIAKELGLKYDTLKKIANGQRKASNRDCIIAIGLVLRVKSDAIDYALSLNDMNELNEEKDNRDNEISDIADKQTNNKLSIKKINSEFLASGLKPLFIINPRSNKKTVADESKQIDYPPFHFISKIHVRTDVNELVYDQYESLSTKYQPSVYKVTSSARLIDERTNKKLKISSYNDKFSVMYEGDVLPTFFQTLEETSDLISICRRISKERENEIKRLKGILNDSRNYGERYSARVVNDTIYIFVEEFNYRIPERGEYYLMEYINGKYALTVLNKSVFMLKYLEESIIKDNYEEDIVEKYGSIEELETLIVEKQGDMEMLLRFRRSAFLRLQERAIEVLDKIKERKIFINNLDYIFDLPMDVIKYYQVEREFKVEYDDTYGEISQMANSAFLGFAMNQQIEITYDDICRAFELGFESIDDICRVKSKYGDIKSVLFPIKTENYYE